MIETITRLQALRGRVAEWKREGLSIGFVPTMGNLHAGHHSLVALARQRADRVVASVFVNPTQFGPNEDYTRYPRTPDEDAAGLAAAGCDALWLPDVSTMYPFGPEASTRIRVPDLTEVLEGARRPGHFDGVCTVVARLFLQVQPDVAAFGRKDFQQLKIVQRMTRDLAFPIEILPGAIIREDDGLAHSSRNRYLSSEERALAPTLHQVLLEMRAAAQADEPHALIEEKAGARLRAAGFEPDYAVLRTPELTMPEDGACGSRVALIAAHLGKTRLIDNLEFELGV